MSAIAPGRYGGNAWSCRRIGLFGGSFNPAHQGHVHLSLLALKSLKLDQVWWLVSPQNPLKSTKGMAPFAERFNQAQRLVRHPRIIVTKLEAELGTRFTADTLRVLHKRFPTIKFVWLMGADNLSSIHKWRHWESIFSTTPVAIFDRPPYSLKASGSLAAKRFQTGRKIGRNQKNLSLIKPPTWAFFHTPRMDISATAIRSETLAGGSSLSS